MSTLDFLDEAKAKNGLPSDYALSKALGLTTSAISNYRSGRSRIDDEVALKLAGLTGRNPLEVIAAANMERAKTPEMRALWESLLTKVAKSFDFLMPRPTPRPA
ncbi:MAG: helix-turn-helix domain-containing protein [Herbaspirillum huttiense]|uniref:helix-turn-helix domain-containing protein n=1 Tax=Herbaspirillum huttiense TaxID=863372 RepID=UPI001ACDB95C|nr:helix-turn-helix domain-containing protein [Herbaspirillum huttiense]MBN9357525.1 helix-turn-helix domain-containing protein [Herbaspirillum huttiense]